MSIAANKVPGVRAALAHDDETAALARQHNNANVLCLAGKTDPAGGRSKIVDAFLNATLRRRPPRTPSQQDGNPESSHRPAPPSSRPRDRATSSNTSASASRRTSS